MKALRDGDVAAAEEDLRHVLAERRDSPLALTLLARIQRQRGDYLEALSSIREARDLAPDYPPLLSEAGALATAMSKHAMAVRWYRRLVRARPEQADGYALLAQAHRSSGNLPGALRNYRRALERDAPNAEQLRQQMARILMQLGNADEAAEIYEQQAVSHPDDLAPLYALANARIQQGRYDEAVVLYREVLRRKPSLVDIHQRLALAKTFDDPEDSDIEAMRNAEVESPLQEEQQAFALGKALDDCNEYDEAFANFERANALQRRRAQPFDFDLFEGMIDEMTAFFDEDWFGGMLKPARLKSQPIFIVGMPESGGALVEQILACHENVSAGGEQSFFTLLSARALYPNVERLTQRMRDIAQWREGYVSTLVRAAGDAPFITDRCPGNFAHLGIIRTLFPDAPVIHCKRDPLDNALAIFRRDFNGSAAFSTALTDIARYRLCHDRLMAHWNKVLPRSVHSVDYESLTQNPPVGVGAILDYCALPPSEACMDFHKTRPGGGSRNSWQIRQPIFRRSVGRAARYAEHLKDIADKLAPPGDD